MRHAFLIIAHNNWEQVKKLICLLDAENHDIYIHAEIRGARILKKMNFTKYRINPKYIFSRIMKYSGAAFP